MSLFLKILKIFGVLVIAVLVIVSAVVYLSGPKLPDDIDGTNDDVLQSDLAEFLKGKNGYVYPENRSIWYESIGKNTSTNGTILLFMGIANDAFGWLQGFIDLLTDNGYQVIRFE